MFYNLVASWFFLGRIKKAPGTFGSLGAYPLCWLLFEQYTGECGIWRYWLIFVLLQLGLLFAAWHAIEKFHQRTMIIDHKSIVIDEVIGQLFAFGLTFQLYLLLWLPLKGQAMQHIIAGEAPLSGVIPLATSWSAMNSLFFISFTLFRIFDIMKPLGIKWLERNVGGAWGVIVDDIAAAMMAAGVFMLMSAVLLLCFA